MAHKQCPILFFSPLTSRGVLQYALITHRIGLSQIAQMPQIIFIIQLICVSQSSICAGRIAITP